MNNDFCYNWLTVYALNTQINRQSKTLTVKYFILMFLHIQLRNQDCRLGNIKCHHHVCLSDNRIKGKLSFLLYVLSYMYSILKLIFSITYTIKVYNNVIIMSINQLNVLPIQRKMQNNINLSKNIV